MQRTERICFAQKEGIRVKFLTNEYNLALTFSMENTLKAYFRFHFLILIVLQEEIKSIIFSIHLKKKTLLTISYALSSIEHRFTFRRVCTEISKHSKNKQMFCSIY